MHSSRCIGPLCISKIIPRLRMNLIYFVSFFEWLLRGHSLPMDLTSISSISTAVASIIQAFSEASRLLEKWRKSRQGKKATGQEELDASLYDGKTSIGAKFRRLSLRHGSRFDIGDSK